MFSEVCKHTPSLTVFDARQNTVRSVAYCRVYADQKPQSRAVQQCFDTAGYMRQQWDARLSIPVNTLHHTLNAQGVNTVNVDAGSRITFHNSLKQVLSIWDNNGNRHRHAYDEQQRLTAIFVSCEGSPEQYFQQLFYSSERTTNSAKNNTGRLIKHIDEAGEMEVQSYALVGAESRVARTFNNAETRLFDTAKSAKLQLAEVYKTHWQYDALGAATLQIDAHGNRQIFGYSIAGQLATLSVGLRHATLTRTPKDASEVLIERIIYDASNRVELEAHGNNVVNRAFYSPLNGRLARLSTTVGGQVIHDQGYRHDAIGNVIGVDNLSVVLRRKSFSVAPTNVFTYDSLSQLIEASGWETTLNTYAQSELEVRPKNLDATLCSPYRQLFEYDAGGNLLELKHAAQARTWVQKMQVASESNRSAISDELDTFNNRDNLSGYFDANGNQLYRGQSRAQSLQWNAQNRLEKTIQVHRGDDGLAFEDDCETYTYSADGRRIRKVTWVRTRSSLRSDDVLYLPGLNIHRSELASFSVVTLQLGLGSIRLYLNTSPGNTDEPQVRYSVEDHQGNNVLELAQDGEWVSQEYFYPFGGTAVWASNSSRATYVKTHRYAGKERDATGLYYYGARYYASGACRWMSTDPAGDVDGLNRYTMLNNNPSTYTDANGLMRSLKDFLPVTKQQALDARTLHFTEYLAPKIMQRKEQDKSAAIEKVKAFNKETEVKAAAEWVEAAYGIIANSQLTFNIDPKKIGTLTGPGMVNVWARPVRNAAYGKRRGLGENALFEYMNPAASPMTQRAANANNIESKAAFRPLYGAVRLGPNIHHFDAPAMTQHAGGAPGYGSSAFYLPESAKPRLTLSAADSLTSMAPFKHLASFENLYPVITYAREDTRALLNGIMHGEPTAILESSTYIEWQSHAAVKWQDMESLTFTETADLEWAQQDQNTLKFFKKQLGQTHIHSLTQHR